jgi:hypothetical protein
MPRAYNQDFDDETNFDQFDQADTLDIAQGEVKPRSKLHMILIAIAVIGAGYLVYRYQCQIIDAAHDVVLTARRGLGVAADSIHDMGARAFGDAQQTIGILDL